MISDLWLLIPLGVAAFCLWMAWITRNDKGE
jgi:hypothetical protein